MRSVVSDVLNWVAERHPALIPQIQVLEVERYEHTGCGLYARFRSVPKGTPTDPVDHEEDRFQHVSAAGAGNPMGKREDMQAALERRTPGGTVPLWEIEFQAWDAASGQHVVLGREFEALSPERQELAMYANAEIMLSVAEEMTRC